MNKPKLSLRRETLVALQPDVLAGVAGGNAFTTKTVTHPTTKTTDAASRIDACPSRAPHGCLTRDVGCPKPTTR